MCDTVYIDLSGFPYYRVYCALIAHFNGHLDVAKYGIKIKHNKLNFMNRVDANMFRHFKKLNEKQFLILFLYTKDKNKGGNIYIKDILDNLIDDIYIGFKKQLFNIHSVFEDDIYKISDTDETLQSLIWNNGYSELYDMWLEDEVSTITMCLLDFKYDIFKILSHYLKNEPLTKTTLKYLNNFKKFIEYDETRVTKIIDRIL